MHKIKDVMSRDVQVISPDATIAEAAKCMRDGDFGMMPVGENDRMVGAISDRDIAVRGVAEGRDGKAKVRDVMSEGIHWAYEESQWSARRRSWRSTRSGACPSSTATSGWWGSWPWPTSR
jgi:predicted transcriptional regulator